jgi:hypothetical protein
MQESLADLEGGVWGARPPKISKNILFLHINEEFAYDKHAFSL